jgi:hypothetical protein
MAVEWGATKACLVCFARDGISVRLEAREDCYVCPRDPAHKFVVKDGVLKRL